jgi:hypothetical protein
MILYLPQPKALRIFVCGHAFLGSYDMLATVLALNEINPFSKPTSDVITSRLACTTYRVKTKSAYALESAGIGNEGV